MNTCVMVLLVWVTLLSQTRSSCDFYDVDLIYNDDEDKMEVFCLHPNFILKSGESLQTSDCKMCVCSDWAMQCCRVDSGSGAMQLSDECEVVPDTSAGPCGYRVVRKDDHSTEC